MSIPITVSTALALVLALPFWLAGPAQAVPVSFAFSGALDHVDPELSSIFVADGTQKFSGNFTYESSTLPSAVGPVSADYNAVTAFNSTVHVGPSSFSPQQITFTTIFSTPNAPNFACAAAAGTCSVTISNNERINGIVTDSFFLQQLAATGFIGSMGSIGGSPPFDAVAILLLDPSAQAFNALSPLPTSLNLSDFDQTAFALFFGPFRASGPLGELAQLSFFQLSPVPEPATLLLFGTTAAGLGLARWRRRRQS